MVTKGCLNDKMLCYLTAQANEAILILTDTLQMDKDLAISVLEQVWPESDIYELPVELEGLSLMNREDVL